MTYKMRTACSLAVLVLLAGVTVATESDSIFHEQVVPILQRRCVGCHSDSESKGGFSVQSEKGAFEGQFIVAGDVESSRLIEAGA